MDDKRSQRAIKNRSRTGISKLEKIWTNREYKLLEELYEYSTNVPKVFAFTSNTILLEYLGTQLQPAPKLSEVNLNKNELNFCFKEVVQNIELFIDFGFVHGDLSAYNILWWNNQAYIIDFPQTLDIKSNKFAYDRFNKDLRNIEEYFKKGIDNSYLQNTFNNLRRMFNQKRIYG